MKLARSPPELEGFESFLFATEGIEHFVYRTGNRRDPVILVLPEIAGFSPGLLLFIERLVAAQFQVYLPWLFGSFGKRAPMRNAVRLCVSREFANLRAGVSAPITSWLRALAAHISRNHDDALIGAIGMCLTGSFVIPLVIDPQVTAAVAAQPSVPMSFRYLWSGESGSGHGGLRKLSELNVSEQHIAQARVRLASGEAHLFALRCRADRICPPEKLERFRREFPVGLVTREYGEPHDRNSVGERPHATFTKEYRVAADAGEDHHSRQALADLLAFFNRHLRGERPHAADSRP